MRRHDIANRWCRFPVGKCTCGRRSQVEYARLHERLDEELDEEGGEGTSVDRAEELVFYNHDESFQTVVVERNLCANDLCQLLAIKNGAEKSVHWCIFEYWVDLGVERQLEDDECVLRAYEDMRRFSEHTNYRYVFRKDYKKYDFFADPLYYFPSGMMNFEKEDGSNKFSQYLKVQNMIWCDEEFPVMFNKVWIRDEEEELWEKTYLILRDKRLFITKKASTVANFMRATRNGAYALLSEENSEINELLYLRDYHVYETINAKNQFLAPTGWGICLRPSGSITDERTPSQLCCLACDSERARSCWIAAMRLAKYGKQLRDNYRAFRNKQSESINSKDYNSYSVPNESVRSRVAMDFTGSVGRIVDDPQEANAIAIAEGYSWKRRWRPTSRLSGPTAAALASIRMQGALEVHLTQPWFHSGLTREQAAELINKHGTCDGVFLVRNSTTNVGCYVITYKSGNKVYHAQIVPQLEGGDRPLYSLDDGGTKFYDILQLVEFYQLNAGSLQTRLTHYVVQNGNTVQRVDQEQQSHTSSSGDPSN